MLRGSSEAEAEAERQACCGARALPAGTRSNDFKRLKSTSHLVSASFYNTLSCKLPEQYDHDSPLGLAFGSVVSSSRRAQVNCSMKVILHVPLSVPGVPSGGRGTRSSRSLPTVFAVVHEFLERLRMRLRATP